MENKSKQLKNILELEDSECKIVEIDVAFRGVVNEIVDDLIIPVFGDIITQYHDIHDDYYLTEKSKGGANSYQAYKPLRDKVKEICKKELDVRHYSSARSLCNVVATTVENK